MSSGGQMAISHGSQGAITTLPCQAKILQIGCRLLSQFVMPGMAPPGVLK